MRILDVGAGKANRTKFFEETFGGLDGKLEIETSDIDASTNPTFTHDITKPFPKKYHEQYNIVWLSHVLEHVRYVDTLQSLTNIRKVMAHLAELWVLTPSLDWCAEQILSEQTSPAVTPSLYGQQDNEHQFHRNGFTLRGLRGLMEQVGLKIRQANVSEYHIDIVTSETKLENGVWKMSPGKHHKVPALQNIVIGVNLIEGQEL